MNRSEMGYIRNVYDSSVRPQTVFVSWKSNMQGQYARTSLNHWCIDSLIHWFIDALIHWFIDSLIHWFIVSLIHWFIDPLNHWFIDSWMHWFIDSLRSHLGAIWEAFGSLRLRRHLGGIWTHFGQPLRSETQKFHLICNFTKGFWGEVCQSIVIYNISWPPAAANGAGDQPRPLSNAVRTPQINLFGE